MYSKSETANPEVKMRWSLADRQGKNLGLKLEVMCKGEKEHYEVK